TKYIGGKEDSVVKLNKLNSAEWAKTRARVKKAVKDMADELIKLYAKREAAQGYAFGPDTDWQNDFERRFPYDETDDQLRCIREIKDDMEKPSPMDRLLCGDVGFGKTEVAIRAAFKCVMDGKQCAVLVPTTILAWQHYQTFRKRMEGFPVKVDILSRFRTPREQEQVLEELRRGQVDIVVGTHRLVQKDVKFKDLGLCIIDEEQRFGVKHKESFKEMRNNVDVLTLSATPIPRTLNMAMSGIRDMSTIEEAPQDRQPVQTYVMEHDWGILVQAISKELRRGGQVFYLHNRVDTIDRCAATIQQFLPDATVVVAHGKMSEEQLSKVWKRLLDHEIDILVCTTIIETGVDVSNCNTLIIEDADRLGLSQLYQIRGRVGRSSRRAFAYLTVTKGKALTDVATKRLEAIREFTTFGSGFRIAMRDLEIRGAGNILGAQQHGHMEAVGYEMYLKMLSEAVAVAKGEKPEVQNTECLVDIRIGAHIPEDYIESLPQRIDIYKKIASVENEKDASDIIDELIDRFGTPPEAVKGLVDVSLLRNMAAGLGIREISQRTDSLLFYPETVDMQAASRLAAGLKGRVMLNAGAKPYLAVKVAKGEKPVDTMRLALTMMAGEAPPAK
ncbi:MAG: transcription-repair coupling factor, partial [Negativibacillus sp.]